MHIGKTVTQSGAAKRLGVTPATIAVLMSRGTLKCVENADGMRSIPVAEVERYAAARSKPAKPRKR